MAVSLMWTLFVAVLAFSALSAVALTGLAKTYWFPVLAVVCWLAYEVVVAGLPKPPGGLGSFGRVDLLLIIPALLFAFACHVIGFAVRYFRQLKQKRLKA